MVCFETCVTSAWISITIKIAIKVDKVQLTIPKIRCFKQSKISTYSFFTRILSLYQCKVYFDIHRINKDIRLCLHYTRFLRKPRRKAYIPRMGLKRYSFHMRKYQQRWFYKNILIFSSSKIHFHDWIYIYCSIICVFLKKAIEDVILYKLGTTHFIFRSGFFSKGSPWDIKVFHFCIIAAFSMFPLLHRITCLYFYQNIKFPCIRSNYHL